MLVSNTFYWTPSILFRGCFNVQSTLFERASNARVWGQFCLQSRFWFYGCFVWIHKPRPHRKLWVLQNTDQSFQTLKTYGCKNKRKSLNKKRHLDLILFFLNKKICYWSFSDRSSSRNSIDLALLGGVFFSFQITDWISLLVGWFLSSDLKRRSGKIEVSKTWTRNNFKITRD